MKNTRVIRRPSPVGFTQKVQDVSGRETWKRKNPLRAEQLGRPVGGEISGEP